MINRLQLGAGASVLGMVVFTVAMHVHFPSEAVIERVQWEIQESSGGSYALEASDASWWMPGGVTFSDATLLSVEQPRRRRSLDDAPPPAGSPMFRADSLSARLALLPLIQGERIVQFAAEVWGGELEGQFGESDTHRLIQVHTDGLDLTRVPLEGDEWSIDARGMLRIDADLEIATERGKDSPPNAGEILIEIDDFVIDSSSVMGMDLMAAEFSEAVLELEMDGKKAKVQRGRFESDLIDLTIDGNVNMSNSDPDRWRLRLELTFTLAEELDRMAAMLPMLKKSRTEDGTFHMMCTGTWGNPICREDRSKVRGKSARPARPSADRDRDRDARGPKDRDRRSEDAKRRREERRKRLEERRNRLRDERPPAGGPEDRFEDPPDIDIEEGFDGGPGRRPRFGPPDDFDGPPPPPDDQGQFDDDFPPPEPEFDEPPHDELPEIGYIDD